MANNNEFTASAEPSVNTASAIASEEEKKNLLEAIKRIFQKLHSIFGRASIVQQMKEMQDTLEASLAQSSITSDTVEDLYELVNDMEGRLDTITPENAEKILEEFQNGTKEIIDRRTADVNDIKIGLKTALEKMGAEVNDSLDNVHIINPDDNNKNHFFIEVNGEVFEAKAEVKTEGSKPDVKITVDGCNETYSDIFTENDELKKGFAYVPTIDGNPEHELVVAVCKANNLNYTFDIEKEKQRQISNLPPRGLFLKSRMDKICSSENGRYESRYFASDASFHVRDTKTGDMIRFKSLPNEIKMYLYRDTKSLNALGSTKEYQLGSWKDNGDGTVQSRVMFDDASVSALLHSTESEKWLKFNGVSKELLAQAYHHDTDITWQKVEGKEAIQRVEALKTACEKAVNNKDYMVQLNNSSRNQFTFLNISPKLQEGQDIKKLPRLSFAFDKEGNPQVINYKGEQSKTKFIYNIKTRNFSTESKEFYTNEEFQAMYNIAYEAIKSIGLGTGMRRIGEKSEIRRIDEAHQEKANKEFVFVPEKERSLNMGNVYDNVLKAYDKQMADKVNTAALYAIKNRRINSAKIQHLLSCDKEETKDILQSLVQLGVVEEGKRNYEAKMTVEEYAKLTSALASDYRKRTPYIDGNRSTSGRDSFAAFLVDSYLRSIERDFAEQKAAYHNEVVSCLKEIGDILHSTKEEPVIENSDIQRVTGSFAQAFTTSKILEKMGVISEDKRIKPRDILCSEEKLKQIFRDFDEAAFKQYEEAQAKRDAGKSGKEKSVKEKPNRKQEGIEQD